VVRKYRAGQAYLGCTLAGSKPEGEQLSQAVEELYALGLGGQYVRKAP
jgi:hypothetical protein